MFILSKFFLSLRSKQYLYFIIIKQIRVSIIIKQINDMQIPKMYSYI